MCALNSESTFHCFVDCNFAHNCWNQLEVDCFVESHELFDWIKKLSEEKSIFECGKVIAVMWGLWINRNNIMWRGSGSSTVCGEFRY